MLRDDTAPRIGRAVPHGVKPIFLRFSAQLHRFKLIDSTPYVRENFSLDARPIPLGEGVMRFNEYDFGRILEAFSGPEGSALAVMMFELSTGKPLEKFEESLVSTARSFNWIAENGALTDMGYCVSASCREYIFWQERNHQLPFEKDAPWLNPSYFDNLKVVEIGCGMGANLMSLQGHATCIGIEPFEIYKQMGHILRKKDGLPEPEIIVAHGEDIPLESHSADVVLCVAAHHYFDVVAVLSEVSRILKSDGEFFVIGWALPEYLDSLRRQRLGTHEIKQAIITLANTASYSFTKKRIFPVHPERNTSRPIYPSASRLRIWMEAADIKADPNRVRLSGADCFQRGQRRRIETTEKTLQLN